MCTMGGRSEAHGPQPAVHRPVRPRRSASESRACAATRPRTPGQSAVSSEGHARTKIRSPLSVISLMTSGDRPEKTACINSQPTAGGFRIFIAPSAEPNISQWKFRTSVMVHLFSSLQGCEFGMVREVVGCSVEQCAETDLLTTSAEFEVA